MHEYSSDPVSPPTPTTSVDFKIDHVVIVIDVGDIRPNTITLSYKEADDLAKQLAPRHQQRNDLINSKIRSLQQLKDSINET